MKTHNLINRLTVIMLVLCSLIIFSVNKASAQNNNLRVWFVLSAKSTQFSRCIIRKHKNRK